MSDMPVTIQKIKEELSKINNQLDERDGKINVGQHGHEDVWVSDQDLEGAFLSYPESGVTIQNQVDLTLKNGKTYMLGLMFGDA